MRLKKLAILGFKSFADKTVLHFDSGITCIVGPNGCGKSNIADAFRWVLGEQSAKSLRGAKMPDVIFAGAIDRKPLNVAEVSLTLTEIQGTLSIDYEEITITRRLYRDGDSEYLLNGNMVRLKDLQDLFLGSGIGKNAFSIFEQNKLDQMINYTPLERRFIFEEAAGILRFLQKKKETMKRLEQADLNLSRVHDIFCEVEKQSHSLESQAQKAKIFIKQKEELEHLEKLSYIIRWQESEKKILHVQTKIKEQQKFLEVFQSKIASVQKQNQEIKILLNEKEKNLISHNEKILMLQNQYEFQKRDCYSFQERLNENFQREKKLSGQLEELILSRTAREKMMQEFNKQQNELQIICNETEIKSSNQQNLVKTHEKQLDQLRQNLTVKQQAHLKCIQKYNELQSEVKQVEIRLENTNERTKQLESRDKQLIIDWERLSQSTDEKKKLLNELSNVITAHKDQINKYDEEILKLSEEGDKKKREIETNQKKLMEIKARQKVLLRMREEHEGFSSGSKKLLKESQNRHSPIYHILRPLYEFFQSDVSEALAVILKAYAQTLVVERERDYHNVLSYAEKEGLQDFSLICLEWCQASEQQLENSFINKVAMNPITQNFLQHVIFASTHHEILCLLKDGKCKEGWSQEGTFIDHRGVTFKMKPNENQVFIRESELKNLEDDDKRKNEYLATLETSFSCLQHSCTHLKLQKIELDKISRKDEMKLVEVNFAFQNALKEQEKNKMDQTHCENELLLLKKNDNELRKKYLLLQQQFNQVKQELAILQNEKDQLQQEVNKEETSWKTQKHDQREKELHFQKLTYDLQKIHHQCQLLEVKGQDDDKMVDRIHSQLEELKQEKKLMILKEKDGKDHLVVLEIELKKEVEFFAQLEKEKEHLSQECEKLSQSFTLQEKEYRDAEREIAQFHFQLENQLHILQSLSEEFCSRYQEQIADLLSFFIPVNQSLTQTEKQIKSLRQSLQEIGNVNLAAIDDLQKLQERYQFLKIQIEDLQNSKKELLNIIQQLDKESEQIFQETFGLIRKNFRKNFQILFSGGEADLQFTDSNNVLEAGIEISAKPPGKQMRSISLLSGGEKCLTALALLFAIFEVKPSPFCILDEVDAPLDDANVERFLNVVKHYVDCCQFLIITHNKRTMAMGDTLFGVYMEEKGVSKLISLEFAEEAPKASLLA